MRILQVAAPTAAGGLERVLEDLSVGLHHRGHEVHVAALLFTEDETHPVVERLQGRDVRVHPIRLRPSEYMRERHEVGALCERIRPDVAHTHGYRVDLLDRGVIARRKVPTVTTVHGASKAGGLKGAFLEWLQRRNYSRFDRVIAVSRALYEESLRDGVHTDRLCLIRNAWAGWHEPAPRAEARVALGLDPSMPVVGWVGRLFPVKGGDVFLRAIARLPEPRPVAAMIGYGPEADHLELEARRLGLTGSVRFYREITDAGNYFRAFDVYVLSSRSEGLPIVILESMAAGTPIVATNVGGITEVLGSEEALIVPPEDPDALAEAIRSSLSDPAAANARSSRAKARLKREFSLEPWLERHEQVYEAVVRTRRY